MYYKGESLFETFFGHRNSLIIQYKNGDISKREFLENNFDFIEKMNVKPFSKIDSYEKGMYNYQYYNMLAKYYAMLASDMRRKRNYGEKYYYCLNKGDFYYNQKDKSTLKFLEYLDFKGIEAYFIRVESKYLKNKLYEIVLKNYKYAIFHSKSKCLLNILKEKGVFIKGEKISLIDEYINERY